jgi:preprotein translocase subunit SecE
MSIRAIILIVVLAAAFVYAWRKGQLAQLADYVRETREELRKCNWPTWNELKGSTAVIMISLALLGAFTVICDYSFMTVLGWITTLTT